MEESLEVRVENYKRYILSDVLDQCTGSQVAFFHRIYPNGVTVDNLDSAIKICERTIKGNEEKQNGKN